MTHSILDALDLPTCRLEVLEEVQTSLTVIEHALRAHHNFQSAFGITYAKDEDGEYYEIDMSNVYGDSTLCEQTLDALKHFETIRALADKGLET